MLTTRRTFFQLIGFLVPPLFANPLGFFRSLFAPEGEVRPLKRPAPNPFVRGGKTLVSVVKGNDVDTMVREAVRLIGGVERLAVQGKTVLVKPNVVSGDPPPTTTNPEVVRSVVRWLRDAGAGRVIVGDMSGLIKLPTMKNLEQTGIAQAAREAGAEVIDFDDADWIEVKPPGAWLTQSIHLAKPVYEADLLINLPVVKTHRNATYSICLKNLVGVTHPRYRPYRVNPNKWEEVVAEINLATHPILNIVDATTIMVADGPWEGPAEKTNLIIARRRPDRRRRRGPGAAQALRQIGAGQQEERLGTTPDRACAAIGGGDQRKKRGGNSNKAARRRQKRILNADRSNEEVHE